MPYADVHELLIVLNNGFVITGIWFSLGLNVNFETGIFCGVLLGSHSLN